MRILLLSTAFGSRDGGLGSRALTLADAWTQMGAEVIVLTSKSSGHGHRCPVIPVRLPGHYILRALALSVELIRVLKRERIDGIFCISWSPEALAAMAARWLFRIPWVVSVNGFDICDALQKRHTRLLARWVFSRANHIVSPTRFLAQQIQRLGDYAGKIHIISNGVDTGIFSPDYRQKPAPSEKKNHRAPVLLTVGRLHPIKGLDTLINAHADLVVHHPDATLIIAGNGPQKDQLVRQVRAHRLQDNVDFVGWVEQQQLPTLYRTADVVIQPSRIVGAFEEGQGISLLEAAACGTPAVGTRSGGIPEVIVDGITGLLAAVDDPGDLQSKIQYLLDHPGLREKMGRNAAKAATEKFDGKRNAAKILRLYQQN